MRIAVLDLLLHYPPQGGACVDVFNTFSRLSYEFDVKLFCPHWNGIAGRGVFKSQPPLPVELVETQSVSREGIVGSLLTAVRAWSPDLVFIADGWTLKPYLLREFKKEFRCILRLYAFEGLCPRNNERWLPDGKCPNHALLDCGRCLKCAEEYGNIVREKRGADNPLTEEAGIARIFSGDYQETLLAALENTDVIVYNRSIAELLKSHSKANPFVVHGGVDSEFFKPSQKRSFGLKKPFRVLVPGRMDDIAKGGACAMEAGRMLAEKGLDFELKITSRPSGKGYAWLKETGWKSQEELRLLVEEADCVVVPSLWDEAFGMAWVEAMAMGAPLVASAAPGPLEGVLDGDSGLLFPQGDAKALADCLLRLASDPDLQKRLSESGFELVRSRFSWDSAVAGTRKVIAAILATAPPARTI